MVVHKFLKIHIYLFEAREGGTEVFQLVFHTLRGLKKKNKTKKTPQKHPRSGPRAHSDLPRVAGDQVAGPFSTAAPENEQGVRSEVESAAGP